jgi:hypothetical protein
MHETTRLVAKWPTTWLYLGYPAKRTARAIGGGMGISVGDLVQMGHLGCAVIAGSAGLDREIRWAHVCELKDPLPWLTGGELVLTHTEVDAVEHPKLAERQATVGHLQTTLVRRPTNRRRAITAGPIANHETPIDNCGTPVSFPW